jgi:2-oxoglutarate dehydrogenase E1 component
MAVPELIEKVVFTSGRLYYSLEKHKHEKGIENVAIIRLEQIHPIPNTQIDKILKKYNTNNLIWAQDEPENMGAWPFLNRKLASLKLKLISRVESASPAVGLMEIHSQSQERIIKTVFEEKEFVSS